MTLSINGVSDNTLGFKNQISRPKIFKSSYLPTSFPDNLNVERITPNEGAKIFFSGIFNQLTSTVKAVVEHPVRTIAIAGSIAAGLMLLPFVGVSTAVGGSVLAIGFAGISIGKGIYHSRQFVLNNQNGSYNQARNNLLNLGGDAFDFAISAPFVPKAFSSINDFTKYGKLKVNVEAIADFKRLPSLKYKLRHLKYLDKEVTRSINFKKSLKAEVMDWEGLNESEQQTVISELLRFDVSENQIPQAVVDKWAELHEIPTKPTVNFRPMSKSTHGYADRSACSISLNDGTCASSSSTIGKDYTFVTRRQIGDVYEYEFLDNQGNRVFDTIDVGIVQDFENANRLFSSSGISPQARKILTTAHEREHIDQFARMFAVDPTNGTFTPEARALYTQMNIERGALTSAQVQEARTMANAPCYHGKPFTVYLKDPMEMGAREVEMALFDSPMFVVLNNTYNRFNQIKTVNSNNTITLNVLRGESGVV